MKAAHAASAPVVERRSAAHARGPRRAEVDSTDIVSLPRFAEDRNRRPGGAGESAIAPTNRGPGDSRSRRIATTSRIPRKVARRPPPNQVAGRRGERRAPPAITASARPACRRVRDPPRSSRREANGKGVGVIHRNRSARRAVAGALLLIAVAAGATARAADRACDAATAAGRAEVSDLRLPPNPDAPTVLDTALRIIELTDIDVRKGQFQFQGYADFAWCDPRLAFDPAEVGSEIQFFSGPAVLEKQAEFWNPDLALANEISGIQVRKREVTIRSDGRVRFRGLFSAHLAANFDLRRFPFDSQVLPIQVESFTWNEDALVFRPDPDGIGVRQDFELPEWKVGAVTSWAGRSPASRRGQQFARFEVDVEIERRVGYYLWKAMLPLFLIVALSWTVFWIPEGIAGRIRLSATVILTIVAYQFAMAADLPKVAYVTFLSAITTVSFLVVALTVVVNLVVFHRQTLGDETAVERSDRLNRWLVPAVYAIVVAGVGFAYLA